MESNLYVESIFEYLILMLMQERDITNYKCSVLLFLAQ